MSPAWISGRSRHIGLLAALVWFPLSGWCGSGVAQGLSQAGGASATSTGTSASTGTVYGRVLNAVTGLAVSRALIRINDRAVLTDQEGKFGFDEVVVGSGVVLLVIKPGFSPFMDPSEPRNLFFRADELGRPVQIRLYPEAVLTGSVIAPDGTPLPRISVTARRSLFDESGHRWMPMGTTQTDSHGSFRLPVPAGEYRLETRYSAQDKTMEEAILPVSLPGGSASNGLDVIRIHSGEEQRFELRPAVSRTHTVSVSVESERGFPQISARSSNGMTLQMNTVRTGPGDEIKVELPSGTFALTATVNSSDGMEQGEASVTVADHDLTGVVLRLSPVPSLPVELIVDQDSASDKAQPNLAQLGLTLQSTQSDPDRFDGTVRLNSGRDRSFSFVAPPGSYRLWARNAGEWYAKSVSYGATDLLRQELIVAPGSGGTPIRVTVSSQTGSLQGMVRLNGAPSVCWVYLVPATASAEAAMIQRSNPDGRYIFAHLPPGSYQAIAFEEHHSADYRDPATLAGFTTHVRAVTVNAQDKPSLDLEAVAAAELAP